MDWNNDRKKDLIAGDTQGNVWVFINSAEKGMPELTDGKRVAADGKLITAKHKEYKRIGGKPVLNKVLPASHELAKKYSKIHMADWDEDGLKDLLVGHINNIILYKNIGTLTVPRFQAPTRIPIPENTLPVKPSPYVVDWDGDGKKDLLVGSAKPKILFYRNIGANNQPQLTQGIPLILQGARFDETYEYRFTVTDWNNDGKKDLVVGNRCRRKEPCFGGNIWLFLGK